jgi:DNA-binding MarR family transcriptional regulator
LIEQLLYLTTVDNRNNTIYRILMNTLNVRSFRKILREFERLSTLQDNSCSQGITLAQCHVILEIEELGQASVGQLAINLGLDKSTLSRTIDALVTQGDVERREDMKDRRYTVITLTEKGQSVCDGINAANDRYYQHVFEQMPAEHQTWFMKTFQQFVSAMKADRQPE